MKLLLRQHNKLILCIAICCIMSNCRVKAINPNACDIFKGISCTGTLSEAIKQCKEKVDVDKCMKTLSDNKECIHCTCTAFPQYCTEKTGEIVPEGPTNPFSSIKIQKDDTHYIDILKILMTALKCEPALFSSCQEKIKKISGNCLLNEKDSVMQCVKDEVSKTECKVCLCKLVPNICTAEEEAAAAGIQKQQQPAAAPSISDAILGGLLQSGVKSESLMGYLKDANVKDQASNLMQNKGLQQKVKEALENEQIKGSLKNLVNSNPEDVSKIAQSVADSKSTEKSISELAAEKLGKFTENKNEKGNTSQLGTNQNKSQSQIQKEQQQQCDKNLKKKCQLQFLKLVKTCPISSNDQKVCVYKQLSGEECEGCICTFIRNLC